MPNLLHLISILHGIEDILDVTFLHQTNPSPMQVVSCSPSLAMSDYRVTYSNHKEFSGSGRKQGSPVRLYTCLPLAQLELPEAEGYRRCRPCGRWVAKENVHCDLCKTCPSKVQEPILVGCNNNGFTKLS